MQAKAVGGVKNLNAIENASEFNNALSENNVRQEKGKSAAYSQRYITNEQRRVSETLKKADDETRAKIFKQAPRLKLYFNNDGSIKGTQAQEKTAEQRSPSGSFSTAPMRASIKTDEKGRQYVQADRQVISGDDPNVWKSQITKYINDVIRQGQDLQIKTVEGDTLTITANTAGKAAFHNENLSKSKFKTKLDAEAHIDELAKTSIARKNIDGTKKIIPDRENKHAKYSVAKDGWNYRNAYFKDSNDNLYKLTLSVAIDGTVESVYNIGLIKKASTNGESRLEPQRAADASTPIIRKSEKKVNTLEEKSLEKVSKQGSSASIKGRENDLVYTPASEVRSDIAETIKDVMLISDGSIDYVVTDDLGDSNGFYDPDSGIMYLSNNAEIEGLRSFVVGHEYTHSLEGTKEYTTLANAILKRISEDKELSKKYDIQDYAVRYVLDAEKSGKKYSKEQYKYIAQTELVADFVGKEMLSNEATIKRIESRNKGIVSKLLQWVKDKISILKSKKGTERDTLKFLLKAEKMLSNAIGASVGGFDVAKIDNDEEKKKTSESIDKDNKGGYTNQDSSLRSSLKFKFQHKNFPSEMESGSEAHRLAIWWTRQPWVEYGDRTLISMNGRWYIVECFADADNHYQVEDRITADRYHYILKEIEKNGEYGKIKSVSRDYVFYDKLNQQGSSVGRKESSIDSSSTGYNKENSKVDGLVATALEKRERLGSDGSGNSASSGAYKQGTNLTTRKFIKQIRYIPYYKIGYNNIEKIRREVWNLYSGIESGVADGIAVDIDNSIYVIDTAKEDGEIRFAVRKVLIADDESLAMEVIRRINNDAISKRYISDGLSSRLRGEYDNSSGSRLQRKSGEKLSDNQGKPQHNEVEVSTENGVGGGRTLTTRKSLKVRDNPNLSQTTTVQGEKDKSLNGKNLRITIVFLGGYLSKIYSIKIQKKL